MKRSESKYFHTSACMDEAFLSILGKKDLAYITVKEICEQAGVNRSTFYLHYETINDLLHESVQYMYDQFLSYMKENSVEAEMATRLQNCPVSDLNLITPKYLTPYLRYIAQNRRLFRTAMENAAVLQTEEIYGKLFRHVFTPILERLRVPEQDRHYIMRFYIQGLIAIITQWLEGDCRDSIDHVIAIITQCVTGRQEENPYSNKTHPGDNSRTGP